MPAPLPSALDPSAHRHRRGVFTPPASSILNHFSTQYATTYQPTMKNTTKDGLPRTMKAVDSTSGATHNNVATTVIPRQRTTANEDIYKRSLPVPYHDASHPYADADSQRQPSIVEAVDEKGDPYTYVSHSPRTQTHPVTEMADDGVTTLSYPPVSDYTARFVSPTAQQAQLEHETSSQPQKYQKNHVLPTHAVPSAIMSSAGGVDVNGHRHNKTAGGYVQNNYNAYFPGARLESETSYSRSFTSANKHHTLPLSTPQRPSDNGYVRNNEYHSVAYGYDGDEMKSSYQMMLEDAQNAPRGDDIPVNKTALISHTELSGFTRGELAPPSQGVGTEDMKLRQLYRQRDRAHVMMTDAGQVMAPPIHTTQQGAFPTNERTGTERSEAQELAQLKHLKRVDPVEYQHRINGTSRYISTSQLVHSAGVRSSVMSTAREAGWDNDESELHDRDGLRHIRQGGLTHFYRTTSQKVNEDTQQYKNLIDAQGKEIGPPQDTGFSTGNANLMSAYGHRPGGHAATYNPSQAYRSHSHATHTNPADSDVGLIEPWRILDERPPSSSYTKLHTRDPLSNRPAYLSDMVSYSLDGSTFLDTRQNQTITRTEAGDRIVTRQLKPLSEVLLHPTVKKIQALQEPPPIKNYGQSHPQEEGLVALAQ